MGMEIERKFLIGDVSQIPLDLSAYRYETIEQGYICTSPVIRVRRMDDSYILTIKGQGMLSREEHELPLDEDTYLKLRDKADGIIIAKHRHLIPLTDVSPDISKELSSLTLELDVFLGLHQGLIMAEIEFPSVEAANSYQPPLWLSHEVTDDERYHNSYLSTHPAPSV